MMHQTCATMQHCESIDPETPFSDAAAVCVSQIRFGTCCRGTADPTMATRWPCSRSCVDATFSICIAIVDAAGFATMCMPVTEHWLVMFAESRDCVLCAR